MPTLLETERAFLVAVLGQGDIEGDACAIAPHVVEDGIPAWARLQIHRNNTVLLLADALAETFPVVKRLVGDDFFAYMARDFIRTHPPTNPSLIFYGRGFARYIDRLEAARGLPYLGDVARLEWAWHDAYHAPEAGRLDVGILAAVPEARLGDLAFRLHPSARFVVSDYPVSAIWRANRKGANADAAISLDDGSTRALVIRPDADVAVHDLTPGAFAFFEALTQGNPVDAAAARAMRADRAFYLETVLGIAIADGTIAEAFLDGQPLNGDTA